MCNYYKAFTLKWMLDIVFLLLILAIFKDYLEVLFLFDLNASDLNQSEFNPMQIKELLLKDLLKLESLLPNLTMMKSLIMPIILIIVGYNYKNISKKLVIYNIGKNSNYNKEKNKLLILCTFIPLTIFTIILTITVVISLINTNMVIGDISRIFVVNSILFKIFSDELGYILFYWISHSIFTIINMIFLFCLIDLSKSVVKATLIYLIILWGISPILYALPFFPLQFVPIHTFMFTANYFISDTLIVTMIIYPLIVTAILYRLNKKEL